MKSRFLQRTAFVPIFFCYLIVGCSETDSDWYVEGVDAYDSAETAEDFEAALALFDKAIQIDSEDVEAYIARGLTHDALGNSDKAIADYEKVLELEPENTDALMNLGAVQHETEDFEGAADSFSRVILLDDDDPDAYRNRALALAKLNQFQAAIDDYTWALILTPFLDPVLYEERAEVWKELGNQVQYDIDIAIVDSSKEIEKDNKNATAYAIRGQSLSLLGEYQLAVKDFTVAIKNDGNNPTFLVSRGNAYNMLGNNSDALSDFEKAIGISSDNSAAYAGRAVVYQSQGEHKSAIADYEKALQIEPELVTSKAGLAWLLSVSRESSLRDGKRAKQLAAAACEATDWENWAFVDVYAAACAEAGEFDLAIENVTQAILLAANVTNVSELKERLALYQDKKPYRVEAK